MQLTSIRKATASKNPFRPGFAAQGEVLKSELWDILGSYLDRHSVTKIKHAYRVSEAAHEGQKRKSGEPYIHHPLEVARILAELRLDHHSIEAAILHDVVEDTELTLDDVQRQFGEDVALLVDGVSKIGQIEFDSREEAEAENFRKMLLAMSRDIRVVLIKLADRLHNMRTIDAMSSQARLRIARQTMEIYAPIANRLGLHPWSRELEDLSFHALYPKRYEAILKSLRHRQGNRRTALKKLQAAIEKQLEAASIEARIESREKNVYSIYRKMRRKRISFREIQDIYGFRVIVDTLEDCYRALGAIHALYKPLPGRFKDYIAIPKINGYQSLHTTVFGAFGETLEVQIRTVDMHRIAEAGVASHWLYKAPQGGNVEPQELARQWLIELLDTQKQSGNAGEFLEHLKVDLFPDAVYVFTPKGEIKKLPQGATALDFAYAVHSDIGNRCTGIRINGQPAPMHTVLSSGQHVEVITSRFRSPSPAWLNFVVTSKARAGIRGFLKNQTRKDSIKLGKKLLDQALKSLKDKRPWIRSRDKVVLLEKLDLESWDDLLADIGLGKRVPMLVAKQLSPSDVDKGAVNTGANPVSIKGAEGIMITYAKCCRPIPGDVVVGYLATGKGMVVHVQDCPNVTELSKRPENWVPVAWDEDVSGHFPVALRIDTENKPGVLASLASIIAEADSNINYVSVVERDGRHSTIGFTIEVRDQAHLGDIMRTLNGQDSILQVVRVKG